MKAIKLNFLIIALFFFLSLPIVSSAMPPINLNLDYPDIGGFNLNNDQDLNEVVAYIYYFVITISGLAVFAMLVWGGFTWMTSTGDPSKIADAKERIYSAFLGLLIILSSFIIMITINPDLVALHLPAMPTNCDDVIDGADCRLTVDCTAAGRSCNYSPLNCSECCCRP